MVNIIKAEPIHVYDIKSLLLQLGYESEESQLLSALSLEDKNSEVFIAIKESKVVGLMSLIYFHYFPIQKSLCRITSIVVNENSRNTGIGKKLIDFALNQAQAKSCAQLEVTTSLSRKATQAYYEQLGFTKASYRYYLNINWY